MLHSVTVHTSIYVTCVHDYQLILLNLVNLTMISKDDFAFSIFLLSCYWKVDLAGLYHLITFLL